MGDVTKIERDERRLDFRDIGAANTIVGDISACETFLKNYSMISGEEFHYTVRDRIRLILYIVIIGGVEDYRKTDEQLKRYFWNAAVKV